jgi:hypothetical protein
MYYFYYMYDICICQEIWSKVVTVSAYKNGKNTSPNYKAIPILNDIGHKSLKSINQ